LISKNKLPLPGSACQTIKIKQKNVRNKGNFLLEKNAADSYIAMDAFPIKR
jgi:hypothetical protein